MRFLPTLMQLGETERHPQRYENLSAGSKVLVETVDVSWWSRSLFPGGIAALVVLVGTALLASYLPARRATLIDPLVALREE